MVTNLALIFVCAVILVKAVDIFITSSTKIAQHFNISGYTISFLLVAIATSLPETVVAITSGIAKKTLLAYGDAMGSNITLITLIIAIPVLLGKDMITRSVLHSKDAYYATFFAFLPVLLSLDGNLMRLDGAILVLAYIAYLTSVMKRSKGLERLVQKFEHVNIWKAWFFFVLSLVFLLVSSRGIVHAALNISQKMGWALSFVGLTFTSLGTSLPEIAFVISSKAKDNQREILGDVVGSVVANSTLVLGTASLLHPIRLQYSSLSSSTILILTIALLLFLKFTRSKEKLEKFEGIILLLVYISFILGEYFLQTQIK
jgi:cation:H+ antiporter